MPSQSHRRSRAWDTDDEEESRAPTPTTTARNDSKRARLQVSDDQQESDIDEPNKQTAASGGLNRAGSASRGRYDREESTLLDEDESTIPARSQTYTQTQKEQKPILLNGRMSTKPRHKPGSIVRVKLVNFVTYTSAEFFPGPTLNMVIGPNGTGKSTLVCAICLGLGQHPNLLGRAKDPAEFVKHGCKEAFIEIELQRHTDGPHKRSRNIIVTRSIKKETNKSLYTLNGQQTTEKAVKGMIKMFDIQIDNLCQFLPQDKVVEFAQMSPIDILQSTQKAAAPPEMLEHHQNLVKLRERQKETLTYSRTDEERLKGLERRQEGQRQDVEKVRERAATQQKLKALELCRPVPKYGDAKDKAKKFKERSNQLKAELSELQKEVGPTLRQVTAKQEYSLQVGKYRDQRQKNAKRAETACDAAYKEIEKYDDELKEKDLQLPAEHNARKKKQEELNKARQRLLPWKAQLEQEPEPFDSRAMTDEIQELINLRREKQSHQQEQQQRIEDLRAQGSARKNKLSEVNQRIGALDTEQGQREGRLEKADRSAFRAWEWIRSNQEEFKHHVYGPPAIECSVKDLRLAGALEALLQPAESMFNIFTVQCTEDFIKLQQQLGRMKIYDVSIKECSIQSLDHFRKPLSSEELQELGLERWAIDLLEGPETVLAMLCMEKRLHLSAIAARDTTSDSHTRISQTRIASYVAGNTSYRFIRRSEYGSAGISASTRTIQQAKVWTDQPVDQGRKAALGREKAELVSELQTIKEEFNTLNAERTETNEDIKGTIEKEHERRAEKDTKQKALVEWNSLPTKIELKEKEIQKIEEGIKEVRANMAAIEVKKDEILLKKVDAVLDHAASLSELKVRHEELLETEVMLLEARSDVEVLIARNQNIKDMLDSKQTEERKASEETAAYHQAARKLMVEIKNLTAQAHDLAANGDTSLVDIISELSGRVTAGQLSAEDLENDIEGEKARLELMEGGDDSIIAQFEKRAQDIEKLRNEIAGRVEQQEALRSAITEVRSQWEPELEALVARISDAFADSFRKIGCAGQVSVYKASSTDPGDCTEELGGTENGLDFEHWAIHISVKFRETEQLSLLDSHRQSGGERAVSTIFYLMALQSLSRAPFRVVDEINQGMDPRNERMVHGRMVDIATSENGSQYFLITPKLLSGLKYKEGMTVLCIVSGENMPDAGQEGNKVDFKKFVRLARELNLSGGTGGAGRRVDSGVGMGSSFGTQTQASQMIVAA